MHQQQLWDFHDEHGVIPLVLDSFGVRKEQSISRHASAVKDGYTVINLS